MAAIPPTQTISPGIVTNLGNFPQYGVQGNTGITSSDLTIVVADNESQKLDYEEEGVLVWFSSESAAENYISSEQTIFGTGGGTPSQDLSGLSAIGNFFGTLTQKNTWIRVAEAVVALVLLDVALKAFTGHSVIETAGNTAKKAGEAGAMVA